MRIYIAPFDGLDVTGHVVVEAETMEEAREKINNDVSKDKTLYIGDIEELDITSPKYFFSSILPRN